MSTRVFQGTDVVEISMSSEDANRLADHLGISSIAGLGSFLHGLAMAEDEDEFSAAWPHLRPSEEEQVEWVKENRVKSCDHKFTREEHNEYDSLVANGRTLYDNLRTQFDWDHGVAFNVAVRDYGRNY